MFLLRADRISFTVSGFDLLRELSFDIPPGLTLVRGGDGRGKTTLLRLMAGDLMPSVGVIERAPQGVCLASTGDASDDPVVGADWLEARRRDRPAWDGALAKRLIARFGLAEHVAKPLFMLSTGSRRKLALVAAFASGAPLVLLDLPFAALDGASSRVLVDLLTDAAGDLHRGCVIADHALHPGLAGLKLAAQIDLGD